MEIHAGEVSVAKQCPRFAGTLQTGKARESPVCTGFRGEPDFWSHQL